MRVFLSYHSPDVAVALALKTAIESAVPGLDVFVDRTHLRYGHLWQPSLFEAIAKAQAFLILVSNRVGDWQKFEYLEALDRKAKDDAFLLVPIIIADRAKGPAANLPLLSQLHWIESTEPTAPEPLAKILAALQSGEVAREPEPWRAINPYRGLVALEEQDADFFFGRDHETEQILKRMMAAPGRLVALIGNSGVGKSSLVRAGVIGALKRHRWPGGELAWPESLKDSRAWAYLTMQPGQDPIAALMSEWARLWFPDATDPRRVDLRTEWTERLRQGKAHLADLIEATDAHFRDALGLMPPPRIFLYIDQGEELYARTPATDRKRFSEIIADGLGTSPQRLIVMLSQRSDYYGQLQANAPLFRLTELIDVPPLDADKLGLVLREPARVLRVRIESEDLVSYIVKSAEDQPGALPLLADLFTDLWERMRVRGDGVLRVFDRREIVQIGASLSRRADLLLARMPDKVDAVKRLFTLRLTHVPRQGEPTRARWEADRAGPEAEAEWALVELLAGPDWRLVVTGERDGKRTAEVAHEIMLKTWPTLKRWLDEERDFLVWRGELDARQQEYARSGEIGAQQQRKALLMGLALDTAKKWLDARGPDIEPEARAYIEQSVRAERVATLTRNVVRTSLAVLLLLAIAGPVGIIFKTQIADLWFKEAVAGPYFRTNFARFILTAEAEHALKPKDHFRECAKDCPKMVVIPAGEFLMGSPDNEGQPTEHPRHKVTIAKPFAVGQFEVTWDDWNACVLMRGCPKLTSEFGEGSEPVINVSWDNAQKYAAWLSKITGKHYRLLSEAEWEYAARGVTSADAPHPAYPWGDRASHDYANYGDDTCCKVKKEGRDQWEYTAPVGQFPPNAFDLYDMQGNVWEWVEDPAHDNYNGAPTDGRVWSENGDDSKRVVRGGSWFASPEFIRSAYRDWDAKGLVYNALGFRIARDIAR